MIYFNSRPSARGDSMSYTTATPTKYFNSRPSARGDEKHMETTATIDLFQFTPLREGRPPLSVIVPYGKISIHAPPRGATDDKKRRDAVVLIFQFTPLREGRPSASRIPLAWILFQFTPLREGRPDVPQLPSKRIISIHAPPRGATYSSTYCSAILTNFNSRPSARGDSA